MKAACKGGRNLRKRHRQSEEDVFKEIEVDLIKPVKKRRRIEIDDTEQQNYDEDTMSDLPSITQLKDNEYVAVAYQDAWYPGCVIESVDSDKVVVNFMVQCRKPGTYMWPSRKKINRLSENVCIKAKSHSRMSKFRVLMYFSFTIQRNYTRSIKNTSFCYSVILKVNDILKLR